MQLTVSRFLNLFEDRFDWLRDNILERVSDYARRIVLSCTNYVANNNPAVPDAYEQPPFFDLFLSRIFAADPTVKGKKRAGAYSDWILRVILLHAEEGNNHVIIRFMAEDFEQVKNDLDVFNRAKQKIAPDKRDLNKFAPPSLNAFRQLQDFVYELKEQGLDQTHNELVAAGITKVHDGEGWEIMIPTTFQASQYLGKFPKSRWCTASQETYFDSYSSEGPLYVIINKTDPSERYQLHPPSSQYMDRDDESINVNAFIEKHDEVRQALSVWCAANNRLEDLEVFDPHTFYAKCVEALKNGETTLDKISVPAAIHCWRTDTLSPEEMNSLLRTPEATEPLFFHKDSFDIRVRNDDAGELLDIVFGSDSWEKKSWENSGSDVYFDHIDHNDIFNYGPGWSAIDKDNTAYIQKAVDKLKVEHSEEFAEFANDYQDSDPSLEEIVREWDHAEEILDQLGMAFRVASERSHQDNEIKAIQEELLSRLDASGIEWNRQGENGRYQVWVTGATLDFGLINQHFNDDYYSEEQSSNYHVNRRDVWHLLDVYVAAKKEQGDIHDDWIDRGYYHGFDVNVSDEDFNVCLDDYLDL